MERVEKVELMQKAIEQLIEEEQVQSKRRQLLEESFVAVDNTINKDDEGEKEAEHRHQLLSQLLTQVLYIFM